MKKCIGAVLCAILLIAALTVTAFAVPQLTNEAVLSDDGKTVTVTIRVEDALGLSAGDIRLAFDTAKYKFKSLDDTVAPDGVMVAAGEAVDEPGLCTCSFMLMQSLEADSLDDKGGIALVSFTFSVLTEAAKETVADDFLLYADSLSAGDDILTAAPVGDVSLFDEHVTGGVTGYASADAPKSNDTAADTKEESAGSSKTLTIVLIILGAVAAAAVGAAVVLNRKKAAIVASGEGDKPDVAKADAKTDDKEPSAKPEDDK